MSHDDPSQSSEGQAMDLIGLAEWAYEIADRHPWAKGDLIRLATNCRTRAKYAALSTKDIKHHE